MVIWNMGKKFCYFYRRGKETRQQVVGDKKLVISLTSFPARIARVHIVIRRLLKNKIQPDKVILNLAISQFPNQLGDLPRKLVELTAIQQYSNTAIQSKLEIRFVEKDTRQFKKFIPTLHEYPDDFIIIVDDDALYRRNLISKLLARAALYPNTIIAGRARYVKMDREGNLKPYKKWWSYTIFANWMKRGSKPRYRNMAIGLGGVLYPPNVLHPDILSEEIYEKIRSAAAQS